MPLGCENPNHGCWQRSDSQAHLVYRKHLRPWLIPTTGNTSNILSRLSGMSLVSVLCQCLEESRWEAIHRVTTNPDRSPVSLCCNVDSLQNLFTVSSLMTRLWMQFNVKLIFSMVLILDWVAAMVWEKSLRNEVQQRWATTKTLLPMWKQIVTLSWGQLLGHESAQESIIFSHDFALLFQVPHLDLHATLG